MSGILDQMSHNCTLPHEQRRLFIPVPRLAALQQDNNPPDTFELSECRRVVKDGREDLRGLEREIEAARLHLQHLIDEKGVLQSQIDAHQQILSSPRRLHMDVLMVIFEAASLGKKSYHSLDVRRAQWSIGQVCQQWRRIITRHMPSLWTDIEIRLSPEEPARNYLLDRLLRRSADQELRVSLHLSQPFGVTVSPANMLTQLFVTSDRWRHFHLDAWSVALGAPLGWSIIAGNLPKLQTITFSSHDEQQVQTISFHRELVAAITSAPLLQTIEVQGSDHVAQSLFEATQSSGLHEKVQRYTWKYDTIENKKIKRHTCSTHPATLLRLQSLVECELDAVFHDSGPVDVVASIPTLQILTIHGKMRKSSRNYFMTARESGPERLLPRLNFPCLKKLVITGDLWDMRALDDFITRSQCTLTTLSIPYIGCDNTCRVLAQTAHLKHFTLSSKNGPEPIFLERFRADVDEARLCPLLSHLVLQFSQPDVDRLVTSFAWEGLANVARTRRNDLAFGAQHENQDKLKTLELSTVHCPSPLAGVLKSPEFHTLTERGLSLELSKCYLDTR